MRAKKTGTSPDTIDTPKLENKNVTFALDIGTRSVVGILGINENSCFHVIDFEQKFHLERAMRDGQIEDIELVAATVKEVKSILEQRNHITLDHASIAAAGRSLKTKRVTYHQELDPTEEITFQLVQAVEYCAVGLAQEEFYSKKPENDDSIDNYYCVGYSIINYIIDDFSTSNPIGHNGKNISLDLIAAFLPQNVIQSLYAVMRLNNLSVENLTLEPIAAINVIVPKDIRLLNIALVDIGAGTSDIAISKNGSIVAYDMVTTAGDEITEDIMQKYLVNFETAERIKLSLNDETADKIDFEDILGNERFDTKAKILKNIKGSIDSVSDAIAARILEINEVAPLAVFLVGGGSQIPGLCRQIAQQLKLAPEFVSIGGKKPFKNITLFSDKLQSPEFVTPIGIGTLTSLYQGCDFFSIKVNGKKLMLLNHGNTKVLDALLLSSFKPQSLIGISPRSIIYYVNGEKFMKRGTNSTPGELYVNGQSASIDTPIKQGDDILVKPAINGVQPEVKVSDLKKDYSSITVTIDDAEITVEPIAKIEDTVLENSYLIKSMDSIDIYVPSTVEQLFSSLNMDCNEFSIFINNSLSYPYSPIINGDIITTKHKTDIALEQTPEIIIEETENTEPITQEQPAEKDLEPAQTIPNHSGRFRVQINGRWQTVIPNEKNQVFFFDMLNYIDIDTKNPNGNIVLKLNGNDVSYTSPVSNGDSVEIYWEKTGL